MAFTHTKKVYIGSFIKARIRIRIRSQMSGSESGSDQKRTGSGSATLHAAESFTQDEFDALFNILYPIQYIENNMVISKFFQVSHYRYL
jgi:hypothetical protein